MTMPEDAQMTDEEFKQLLDGRDWEELKNTQCRVWHRALTNREIAEIYRRLNDHRGA